MENKAKENKTIDRHPATGEFPSPVTILCTWGVIALVTRVRYFETVHYVNGTLKAKHVAENSIALHVLAPARIFQRDRPGKGT